MKNIIQTVAGLSAMCFASLAFSFGEVNHTWPNHSGYNLDQIIQIQKAPNPNFGGFYWAHQYTVGNVADSDTMYMGLQQQMDGSRNVNFAIFYKPTTVANPDNVKCTPPFNCVSSGGAGDGAPGARVWGPYAWVAGHQYRLRVWTTSQGWWTFYVKDITTNVETEIGSIYSQDFPNGTLNPNNSSGTWEEVFGGQQHSGNCAYSPHRVYWTRPTMDNGAVTPTLSTPTKLSPESPFRIFSAAGFAKYEVLTCPIGGIPRGVFGKTACYFLGKDSASCSTVCSQTIKLPPPAYSGQCSAAIPYNRGGVALKAMTGYIGTPTQGGSKANCDGLLQTFGKTPANIDTRVDSLGLGCYDWGGGGTRWVDNINLDATSAEVGVKRVCGCTP